MKRASLKNTLLLAVAAVVVATGVVLSLVLIHRYSISVLHEAGTKAENIAHKLALDATDKILINDLVSLQKMLDDQMASDPAVAYLFVEQNGRVLAHTFPYGLPEQLIDANRPLDKSGGHLKKLITDTNNRYIDIAWPIFEGNAGVLRLGLTEKPFRQKVNQLWLQTSLITLGILLVALLACQVLILHLLRPLMQLTRSAENIDAGNMDAQIEVSGRTEVQRLAAAFNAMLKRIKQYTHQLQSEAQKLEKKNLALDRAHRQLEASFSISQQVAALGDIRKVIHFLLETIRDIVECEHMTILVFNHQDKSVMMAGELQPATNDKDAYRRLNEAVSSVDDHQFVDADKTLLPRLKPGGTARRTAVFAIRYRDYLIGALIVACPGNCHCVRKELDVISLILQQTAGAIYRAAHHEAELSQLRDKVAPSARFVGMVGKSKQMYLIYKLIEDVAPTDATVLIQGESGTGKEMVARAIHQLSPRKDNPFIVINCSAYPATLLESELFGHEKGSFSGALRRKLGRFEQAHGGTVFLDEIGEIPPTAQIKLLRVLQSQKFERVGGEQTLHVDVRILAATNRNLADEVKAGRFREDLFYRLNVIPITVPPLRRRFNDIPLLADHFRQTFARAQKSDVERISPGALRLLMGHRWPGNVRELENAIEHAVVLAKGDRINTADLPAGLLDAKYQEHVKETPFPAPTMVENEARLIRQVLEACDWNKSAAADQLGISRSTLYEKLKKYRVVQPTIQ